MFKKKQNSSINARIEKYEDEDIYENEETIPRQEEYTIVERRNGLFGNGLGTNNACLILIVVALLFVAYILYTNYRNKNTNVGTNNIQLPETETKKPLRTSFTTYQQQPNNTVFFDNVNTPQQYDQNMFYNNQPQGVQYQQQQKQPNKGFLGKIFQFIHNKTKLN
ncbi:hypothetical protein [Heterosigma akashiwo virus 01]|uniref:Transmembrane protein n=1 Tax=Heterosigma akashiwo virus 01 TaxID=97195 RepID=A0A1C9C5E6_HAV01|nr:hypothetical protein D1R72_gp175 [Heterosigma akashiwo virus 01]AOM63506.1 hypothetical protein [Heterosigma akashiwo virus 01]